MYNTEKGLLHITPEKGGRLRSVMPAVVRHLLGIGIQDERGLLQKKLRLLLCFVIINELIDPFSHKLRSAAYSNLIRTIERSQIFEECK